MSGEIYWVQYQISVQFSTWIFLKIFLEHQNLNQSAHFLKQQSSLYCTDRYHCNKETEKPSYSYYYHISDDLTHKVKWISMKLKFHNLNLTTVHASISTNVFYFWQSLAKEHKKNYIIHYGVSGHGKGQVDAMSGFGVKSPLHKAIVIENFFYTTSKWKWKWLLACASQIYSFIAIIATSHHQKKLTRKSFM